MRSGRKAGVGLLVTMLVLIGLVVLADRGAAWAAENQISEQIATKAAEQKIEMQGEPEVTVEGFPFLTQVFAGEYQAIRIRMRQVSLDGVNLDTLDVRATGVKADVSDVMNGSGEARAGRVTGDATVPFSAVEEMIGLRGATVSGQDGKLLVRTPLEAAGGRVKVTAVARAGVSVSDGKIKIVVEKVDVAEGELPSYAQSLLDDLAASVAREIPLPSLPYGLVLQGARITDAGVVATASASDVALVS